MIPEAQSGLLNFETAVVDLFGAEYGIGERLSVPLQLSGFRDPDVLKSLRRLQASMPPDVQAILSRAETATPELLNDPTFQLRVAFLPVVPASGRSPDAVAYFLRPGDVPAELAESLSHYVVLPKPMRGQRATLKAMQVIDEFKRRTGFSLNTTDHIVAGIHYKVRPPRDEERRTLDESFAEYHGAFKSFLYTQAWIDKLVDELSSEERFAEVCGHPPIRLERPLPFETD